MLPSFDHVFPSGSLTGALASSLDGSSCQLGPQSQWPPALLHSFQLCLDSPVLQAIYWGPDFVMLYGDAYIAALADKHPWALGRSAREVWAEIWHVIGPQLSDVFLTGKAYVSPHQRLDLLQHGTLRKRYFNYVYSPIRDAEGHVCGVLKTALETTSEVSAVTARAQAQSELDRQTLVSTQTRSLLQLLTDGTPDLIYVKDASGRMVHVNNMVCRMFGRPRREFIGNTDEAWLPPEQAARVMLNDQLVMASRQSHTFEEEVQVVGDVGDVGLADAGALDEKPAVDDAPDARQPANSKPWMVTRLYHSTKSPWLSPDGTLLGMFGISRDITERKAQENLLRQLNATLEEQVTQRTLERDRIWRVSRDIFVVVDTEGHYVSVNPAFFRVLGWTLEETVAMQPFSLMHPDDVALGREQFAKVVNGATSVSFTGRHRHTDGHYRWLNWTAVKEGCLVYAVARDVTEERAQTETLARAEEQLRQAQKMEAVGQLTGGIAHDFNNLLATIMSSLELVQRRTASGQLGDLERYVTAARSSAQRAAALTQRLLAFSRRQALDPQPLDVNVLVTGMHDLLHRTLGENVKLETVLQPLPPAFTDANQLENALLNLVINARDAMPQGGTLSIRTGVERLEPGRLRMPEDLPPEGADFVMVSVSDTGIGMTPDIIGKAFDPFFTTKPIGQGTGLGLSMIYGYVKQSGGHVTIESRTGRGTSVKLYLPQLSPAAAAEGKAAQHKNDQETDLSAADATAPEPTPLGAGESILVVEDEAGVRMVVLEVLRELGYATHEAVDATSALKLVDAGIAIDLMVSDVGLPGTNGRQLAEMVRVRRPGLKVLFITGYTGHAAVRGEFLDKGMAMLTKPFAIDDLAQKIKTMLADA